MSNMSLTGCYKTTVFFTFIHSSTKDGIEPITTTNFSSLYRIIRWFLSWLVWTDRHDCILTCLFTYNKHAVNYRLRDSYRKLLYCTSIV